MILSAEELNKLIEAAIKKALNCYEFDVKEIIAREIFEAIDKHLDEYIHVEQQLTDVEKDE